MTFNQALAEFLESEGFGEFGKTLFITRVPNSVQSPTEVYWLEGSGGTISGLNRTGELVKNHTALIYYRSMSARKVDEKLTELERILNCHKCVNLNGFDVLSLNANVFGARIDLDIENRFYGFIEFNAVTYENCK